MGTLQLRLSGTVSDVMGNIVEVPVDDDAVYTFASAEPARKTIIFDGSVTSVLTTTPHTFNGVDGVTIGNSGVPGAGFHTVVVAIPKALVPGGLLFARLKVAVTTGP